MGSHGDGVLEIRRATVGGAADWRGGGIDASTKADQHGEL
jgi:hypothetical protein